LGVNPGFTHFKGLRGILGFGSFSPLLSAVSLQYDIWKNHHLHRDIIIILYIYIYTGGGFRGIYKIGIKYVFSGMGHFIEFPPDSIDMIDSMILWMKIMLYSTVY
jgi:hypothetical protein